MKRINLSLKQAIVCFILFLMYSCQKKDFIKNDLKASEIESAKSWFEKQPHADFLVDWDKAKYNKVSDRVIVPLIWNALSGQGGLTTRKLSISGNSTANRKALIVEIVPSEQYFRKKQAEFDPNLFEGFLSVLDLGLTFQYGEFYTDGTKQYSASRDTYKSDEEFERTPKSESCYYSSYAYVSGGVVTVVGYTYCVNSIPGGGGAGGCGCSSGEPDKPIEWEIDEGDGELEQGQAPPPVYARVREVIDSLTTPCFKSTLAMLMNTNTTVAMNDIINNTFNYNNQVTATFFESSFDRNIMAYTRPVYKPNGFIDIGITLNKAGMANSSREYVASTILHEMIHGFFDANGQQPLSDQNNIHHQVMANEYIAKMADALMKLFPTLPSSDATALAWGGLTETIAWKNLQISNPTKANSILATANRYHTGILGVFCN